MLDCLDLGCGTERVPGYIPVDQYANGDPRVKIVDLTKLPWPWKDNSIGRIRMWHCLEHLPNGPMQIMAEIHRILMPGGEVLIAVPSIRGPWAAFWDHRHLFSAFWFQQYAAKATPWLPVRPEWTHVKITKVLMMEGFDANGPIAAPVIRFLNWVINTVPHWEKTGLFPEDAVHFEARKPLL
jgi:predicted SAM-dependent methyltransferase